MCSMTTYTTHRLDGLEPDNLLAFMALLGLLRSLEAVRPSWRARAFWTINDPPLRPAIRLSGNVSNDTLAQSVAAGINLLASHHNFGDHKSLKLPVAYATGILKEAAEMGDQNGYTADLWAALVSDAAVSQNGQNVDPTPLCLMFGQGHQHFLERLASVPREKAPPDRGRGQGKQKISETKCVSEALFSFWQRPDATQSFRWDPNEDVRYAMRARDPTDSTTKDTTQHGANRLAAIGLSVLTVVPTIEFGRVRLAVLGGLRQHRGAFIFQWPIWRDPISLVHIRSLLGHPKLNNPETQNALGIVEVRKARRISTGKFMNFTRATQGSRP